MAQLEIKCLNVGLIQTNAYVAYDDEIKEAVIIDPGAEADRLSDCIEQLGLSLKAVLLTHSHSDHYQALAELKEKYKMPVYLNELDKYRLKDQKGFVDASYDWADDDIFVNDGDHLSIGGMEIDVIHTPGHTEGGVCYYFKNNGVLFAGDTLFFHSWGRTDFPGGNERALMASIRNKLLVLPKEVLVLPGHERATSIEEERMVHNFKGE